MPAILNPHGVETEADDWLIDKMQRENKWKGFERLPAKREGTGPRMRIALLVGNNGIGDDIHAMPALAQKIADGYTVVVYGREFTRLCYESVGCEFHVMDKLRFGFYETALTEYGAVYHLSQWCIAHESDTLGKPTLTRFEQFAALLETNLPASFNWRQYLCPTRYISPPFGRSLVTAMHATALQRSYPLTASLYTALEKSKVFRSYQHTRLGNAPIEYRVASLREMITLIDIANVCISVDTGPLQIALAIGTPCVAVFGGSRADIIVDQYRRYVDTPYRVVQRTQHDAQCERPCSFHRANGYQRDDKCKRGADCMTEIQPRDILHAARAIARK